VLQAHVTSISKQFSIHVEKLRFLNVNLRRVDFGLKFMENAGHFRVKNPLSNDVTSISERGLKAVKFYLF
jgi:hypothetical protein